MPPREGDGPFLRAIEADFDADLPRLVYADWLEERGTDGDGVRARFIRHQIAEGSRESFAEFGPAVYGTLPGWLPRKPLVRGFAAPRRWKPGTFASGVAAFSAAAPLPPALRFDWSAGDLRYESAFARPELAAVRSLSVELTDRAAGAFADCESLGNLDRFAFTLPYRSATNISEHVAASANFRRLGTVAIRHPDVFTGSELIDLLRAPAGLRRAELVGGTGYVTPEQRRDPWANALAAPLPGLRSLSLDGRLGFDPLGVLAGAVGLTGLRDLAVLNHALTDAGVAELLATPHLAGVRRLDLSWLARFGRRHARLTDAGARLILADPRPWEAVDLAGSAVSPGLLAEIAARCGAGA